MKRCLWRGGFREQDRGDNGAVTSTLGSPTASPTPPATPPAPVPPASRVARPGWRDPRLWVGVAIVAASVILGSRVLASADDTVAVWVVAEDAAAGEVLGPDDLETARLRFADDDRLARYFTVDDALPEALRLRRGLGAGDLLPRDALGEESLADIVELPVPVAPLLVPPAVTAGSVVDVYVSDRGATSGSQGRRVDTGPARPALAEVTVVDAPRPDDAFAASGDRQVVLAVEASAVSTFYGVLDAMSDPVVSIVRRG